MIGTVYEMGQAACSYTGKGDWQTRRVYMINFEEELKKFHPSLEIDEAEDVIINHSLADFTDILVQMVKEQENRDNKEK